MQENQLRFKTATEMTPQTFTMRYVDCIRHYESFKKSWLNYNLNTILIFLSHKQLLNNIACKKFSSHTINAQNIFSSLCYLAEFFFFLNYLHGNQQENHTTAGPASCTVVTAHVCQSLLVHACKNHSISPPVSHSKRLRYSEQAHLFPLLFVFLLFTPYRLSVFQTPST